jgi:NADH-quinone oxidoreductase subunit M
VGELFTLMGGFKSAVLPTWVAALGTIGIILAAAYFLWTLQRMFLGKLWAKNQEDLVVLYDLDTREKWMLIPLGLLAFLIGILPNSLFQLSDKTVSQLLKVFE